MGSTRGQEKRLVGQREELNLDVAESREASKELRLFSHRRSICRDGVPISWVQTWGSLPSQAPIETQLGTRGEGSLGGRRGSFSFLKIMDWGGCLFFQRPQ